MYERTTERQHLSVANVLSAPTDVTFSRPQDHLMDNKPGPSVLGTLIGTASHCVINVNMAGPAGVQTEKHDNLLELRQTVL